MRGHVAEPFDAGRLHGGVGVQALGNGVGDDSLALLLQQFHQPPLLPHEPVNLPGLVVQKCGDEGLLRERWNRQWEVTDLSLIKRWHGPWVSDHVEPDKAHCVFQEGTASHFVADHDPHHVVVQTRIIVEHADSSQQQGCAHLSEYDRLRRKDEGT